MAFILLCTVPVSCFIISVHVDPRVLTESVRACPAYIHILL